MFTRIVEIRTKQGKAKEVSQTVNEKILPLLKKQTGFLDEITLISNTDPDRILALSFWKSESDAENYNREQYSNVQQIISQYLDTPPKVQTFEVDTSTVHNIAKGKAA
jgi:quinol monooxygenase YgiN